MSITVVDTQYSTRNHPTGNNFPLWNVDQIVTDTVDITCNFNFESTLNEQVIITANNQIKIQGSTWSQKGYVVGDNVLIYGIINNVGATVNFGGLSRNIIGLSGDTMVLNSTLDTGSTAIQQWVFLITHVQHPKQ